LPSNRIVSSVSPYQRDAQPLLLGVGRVGAHIHDLVKNRPHDTESQIARLLDGPQDRTFHVRPEIAHAERIHDLELTSIDEQWAAHTYQHTLVFQKIHATCFNTKKVRKKCSISANNINDIKHVTYRIEVEHRGVTTINDGFAPDVLAHKIANLIEELLIIKSVH
jgi:hypothetical protein